MDFPDLSEHFAPTIFVSRDEEKLWLSCSP